jgi:hypothetical protein
MFNKIYFIPLLILLFGIGCTVMKTQHHIILDHNITLEVKIEKEVDSFLDDLYGSDDLNN